MTSEYLKDIPDWIKIPTLLSDPADIEQLLTQINFLKGAYVGHSGRIVELEEQVTLARKYQQELDAQTAQVAGNTVLARMIRSQEV